MYELLDCCNRSQLQVTASSIMTPEGVMPNFQVRGVRRVRAYLLVCVRACVFLCDYLYVCDMCDVCVCVCALCVARTRVHTCLYSKHA